MAKKIFFVMGVSGSGKSTIGQMFAQKLRLPFFDGDDFHPKANIDKMASGQPLNDTDRQGWLEQLNELAKEHLQQGAVIACSALKKKYRNTLQRGIEPQVSFIYLEGSFEEIQSRMALRKDHFMPPNLLKSQFDTLEKPEQAIVVSIANTPEVIVQNILKNL